MKTYGIYMGGRKRGTVKTDDIHEYASKVYKQGYEVQGSKLIVAEMSLGEAMANAMQQIKGSTDEETPTEKHPSRYLVIEDIETQERFRFDPFKTKNPAGYVPDGFRKVTHSIPCSEEYWILPIFE